MDRHAEVSTKTGVRGRGAQRVRPGPKAPIQPPLQLFESSIDKRRQLFAFNQELCDFSTSLSAVALGTSWK